MPGTLLNQYELFHTISGPAVEKQGADQLRVEQRSVHPEQGGVYTVEATVWR